MMKVEVQAAEPCRRRLHIEVPAEDVRKDYEAVVHMFLTEGSLPGFRKGKVPRPLIERQYSKAIDEEFRRLVIPKTYRNAIRQENLSIVSIVDVANVELSPATGLVCDVTVDVAPEFELPAYDGIPIERVEVAVGDAEVDSGIAELQNRMASFDEPAEGYAAAEGDAVQADYQGFADGQPLASVVDDAGAMASASDVWMVVGSDSTAVPGMAGVLAGATAGVVREFDATFGDDAKPEALRGRTVHYAVTVKAVRQRKVPDVDEAFCTQIGIESPEALREIVRKRLEQEAEFQDAQRRSREISDHLLQHTVFDLPQTMVEQETRSAIQALVRNSLQSGVDREKIAQEQSALVEAARQTAQRRLRLSYILLRIADAEKIAATDREVEARIEQIARGREIPPEQARAEIEENYGIDALQNEIRSNKAMTWLMAHAKDA